MELTTVHQGGQEVEQATYLTQEVDQSTTLTASECEVTNGFVKNGTSLPYIIETNNSGENTQHGKYVKPEI